VEDMIVRAGKLYVLVGFIGVKIASVKDARKRGKNRFIMKRRYELERCK
jgi:hypothetical protein